MTSILRSVIRMRSQVCLDDNFNCNPTCGSVQAQSRQLRFQTEAAAEEINNMLPSVVSGL